MNRAKSGDIPEHERIRKSSDFQKTGHYVVCELSISSNFGLCLHPSIASDYMDS
jgi:hypothetical protein